MNAAGAGQFLLIVDTINDAIRDTVRALGGAKIVAPMLWPKKAPEAAARYLDDCLNPNREHKLDIEEILLIAKKGREKGIHMIVGFINQDVAYAPPVPVDPADQKAEFQRIFGERIGELGDMFAIAQRNGWLKK